MRTAGDFTVFVPFRREYDAPNVAALLTRLRSTLLAGFVIAGSLGCCPQALAQANASPGPTGQIRSTRAERFKDFANDAAGPVVLVETVGWTALAQARNTPEEWGRGAGGFGRRYASLVGQSVIQEGVTYGLSELTGVDSRFHKSAKHGFLPRSGDALLQSVTSRRASGARVVSAPLLAGYAVGGIGMMTWYPDRYTVKDGAGYGVLALASRVGVNLIREFVLRR
jgi:hypothetical protein